MRKKEEPIWFTPDDKRQPLRATVKADGTVCVGRPLRKVLGTSPVRIGFLKAEHAMILKTDAEAGFPLSKSGIIRLSGLSRQVLGMGILFPVVFFFKKDPTGCFFKGTCKLQPNNSGYPPAFRKLGNISLFSDYLSRSQFMKEVLQGREKQIYRLFLEGRSASEIAGAFALSQTELREIHESIMEKWRHFSTN